jgi:quinol monooxygenase YgiN
MIVVSGIIEFDGEHRAQALALIRPLVSATNDEDGCISYAFFEDPFRPGRFRLFEEWTDGEALARHLEAPHVTAFRTGLGELGEITADVTRYDVSHCGPNR